MGKVLETELILDWYDGVVLALVRPSWREGIFLASLISWSQNERKRVLVLLPTTTAEASGITRDAAGGWDELIARLHELAQMATGKVSVVVVDEATDEVIREESIDVESIRAHLIGDIEQALQVDVMPWLS